MLLPVVRRPLDRVRAVLTVTLPVVVTPLTLLMVKVPKVTPPVPGIVCAAEPENVHGLAPGLKVPVPVRLPLTVTADVTPTADRALVPRLMLPKVKLPPPPRLRLLPSVTLAADRSNVPSLMMPALPALPPRVMVPAAVALSVEPACTMILPIALTTGALMVTGAPAAMVAEPPAAGIPPSQFIQVAGVFHAPPGLADVQPESGLKATIAAAQADMLLDVAVQVIVGVVPCVAITWSEDCPAGKPLLFGKKPSCVQVPVPVVVKLPKLTAGHRIDTKADTSWLGLVVGPPSEMVAVGVVPVTVLCWSRPAKPEYSTAVASTWDNQGDPTPVRAVRAVMRKGEQALVITADNSAPS